MGLPVWPWAPGLRPAVTMLAMIVALMLAETVRSWRNADRLRGLGAVEPDGDVYPIMQVAYPLAFLAMAAEGAWRGWPPDWCITSGLVVFAAAKAIKYAAVAALGELWSFRVLALPGAPLVRSGPYRVFRHPNYIGVMGELAGAAVMFAAPATGLAFTIAFALLLRARIRVEEAALGMRPDGAAGSAASTAT